MNAMRVCTRMGALFFCLAVTGCFPISAAEVVLPEQHVVASPLEEEVFSPGAVTVVRPKEMQGEQKNLPDLLKRVPGLHVVEARGRGAYTVASVRGSTSAQVAVYIDGTLANLGSEAAVDLSAIPVDDVERIEVYRGYVPSRFNRAAMGGVINIVTRKPKGSEASLTLGVSSYGGARSGLFWSRPLRGGAFSLGVAHERSDGDFAYWNDNDTPYTPEDDYEAKRRNNSFSRTNLLMKWEDESWHARFSWREDDRALPLPAPGFDRPGAQEPRGAELDTRQWSLAVGRRRNAGDVEWGWRAEWLDQKKTYDDPDDVIGGWGERHNEYRAQRAGFAVDASLPIGESHFAELLIDYSRETLDVRGDIVQGLGGLDSFAQESLNIHLQDTIALDGTGNFLLTPVLRWNVNDGEGKFSWGAGVIRELENGWSWRASFGSYNRAPNLYERYGDGASIRPAPDLSWEEGTQADVRRSVARRGRRSSPRRRRDVLCQAFERPDRIRDDEPPLRCVPEYRRGARAGRRAGVERRTGSVGTFRLVYLDGRGERDARRLQAGEATSQSSGMGGPSQAFQNSLRRKGQSLYGVSLYRRDVLRQRRNDPLG